MDRISLPRVPSTTLSHEIRPLAMNSYRGADSEHGRCTRSEDCRLPGQQPRRAARQGPQGFPQSFCPRRFLRPPWLSPAPATSRTSCSPQSGRVAAPPGGSPSLCLWARRLCLLPVSGFIPAAPTAAEASPPRA